MDSIADLLTEYEQEAARLQARIEEAKRARDGCGTRLCDADRRIGTLTQLYDNLFCAIVQIREYLARPVTLSASEKEAEKWK